MDYFLLTLKGQKTVKQPRHLMIPSKQIQKGQMATLVKILVGINDSFSDFSPFLFYDPLCVPNMTINVFFLTRVGRGSESNKKLAWKKMKPFSKTKFNLLYLTLTSNWCNNKLYRFWYLKYAIILMPLFTCKNFRKPEEFF